MLFITAWKMLLSILNNNEINSVTVIQNHKNCYLIFLQIPKSQVSAVHIIFQSNKI